jgi:tetratricopeptide (TPR) repeat protein
MNRPTDIVRRTEVLYALAHRKMGEENYADAAALLRLMLHFAPTDDRCSLALGVCHERQGQLRLAAELYASGVLAANPAGRCALACARILDRQDRSQEAEELYQHAAEALEKSGDDALLLVCRQEMEVRR